MANEKEITAAVVAAVRELLPTIQQTGNAKVDLETLGAVLREQMNPTIQDRQRLEEPTKGRQQLRIRVISNTGSRFVAVLEEGDNRLTGKRELVLRGIEDYEYPWSQELEDANRFERAPRKFWKGATWSWGGMRGVLLESGKLSWEAKKKLWDDCWAVDLKSWEKLTLEESARWGLRVDQEQPKSEPVK